MAKDIKKNVKEDYWQNTSHSARVKEYDDGTKQLYSYGTLIATIKPDGDVELTRYWNYSRTTGQHLRDFLRKYGIGNYGSSESIYNDLILKRKVEDDNIELRKMAALQNAIDELKYGKGDKDDCDWCGLSQNDFNDVWKQAKKEVRDLQKQQQNKNMKEEKEMKDAKYTQRPEKLIKESKDEKKSIKESNDHKTIEANDCDFIALTEYEGGEPIGYTKSDKELQQWLDADEEHSWFPVDDYDDCVYLCADECPYCHGGNIEEVDCDDESCKYVCYDCGNDFIVWDDGSITDRHNNPIEESCKKEEKLSMKVTREEKPIVKESKNITKKSKSLKESRKLNESYYGDIIDDLVDRAKSGIRDYGEDVDSAVSNAIDEGLIYSYDILELARHYDTLPDDMELLEGFYDDLYSEIYSEVEDYADEYREEALENLPTEYSLSLDDLGIDNEDYYINDVYDDDDIYNEVESFLNDSVLGDYDVDAYVDSFEFEVEDDGSGDISVTDIEWALNESLKSKKGKKAIKESKKSTKTKKEVKESKTNKNNKK